MFRVSSAIRFLGFRDDGFGVRVWYAPWLRIQPFGLYRHFTVFRILDLGVEGFMFRI